MPPVKQSNQPAWKSGVYLIRNIVNNKVYVGSAAINIEYRWRQHKKNLRDHKHRNRHLQNAWNKYGEKSFAFSVLIRCSPTDCIHHEQFLIDKYNSSDRRFGYNISPTAGSCIGVTHTDETKAKMSKARRGKKRSPEATAKCAAANRGLKRSNEAKARMSAAHKGKKMSAELLEKLRTVHLGKALSNEHKAKLSIAAKCRSVDCYKKMWETRRSNKLAKTIKDDEFIPHQIRI